MKKSITLVTVGALALSLVGCAGSPNDEDVLTVWGWRADHSWKELVESYEPPDGMQIEYRSFKPDEYNKVLQNGLSGSSGPDIVMLRSYGGLDTLVAGGKISALDGSPALANLSDTVVDGARSHVDGKVYGVPFQIVTANILYNKEIFDELGLKEPETWDEFIEVNKKLEEADVIPLAAGTLDSWILPIYRDMFGGSLYGGSEFAQELEEGTTDFTDERYTEANQLLADLTAYFPSGFEGLAYADANALFTSGEAAMYPGGIWELAAFREAMEGTEIGMFDPPAVDGSETMTMGYVDGSFGMSSSLKGDEKKAAEGFLEWVGSEEFGQKIADDLLSLPVVEGVVPQDDLLAEAAEGFAANPSPYLTYVYFDYGTPSGTSLEYDNLQKLVIGSASAADVGVAVHNGVSQWFTPTQ